MNLPLLAFVAGLALGQDRPVTLNVTISAPPDTGYSLTAGEVSRTGRTAALEGLSAGAAIEVLPEGGAVPVRLDFYDEEGLLARCKPLSVPIKEFEPGCDPSFTLTPAGAGPRAVVCQEACALSSVERRKKTARGWIPLNPWLPPLER